jgi:uncharacterized protein (TIGR01777 family)
LHNFMFTGMRNEKNGKAPSVLITGGNGLVGKNLTSALLSEGYRVSHLSRQPNDRGTVKVFAWDPEKGVLDEGAMEGIDYLIHLAGANLGEKRWSAARKKKIISSRVDSARLLFRTVTGKNIKLKAYISASAVGYYGSVTSGRIFTEEDPPADDFLGTTCRLWEEGASLFAASGIRTVIIRTAVVLDKKDGALGKLYRFARFGLAVRLGSGRQYFPWIHPGDLCGIYTKALDDETMHGPYNASAPEYITQGDLMNKIRKLGQTRAILIPVPSVGPRMVLGEMSDIVLKGSRVSPLKITGAGYIFRFPEIDGALRDIMGS